MKENILFFYKGSHGELHAGLPILMEILAKRENIEIYFVYSDIVTFDAIPPFYVKIINDNFNVKFVDKKDFVPFYLKHFYSKNYIITCDNGHTRYTKLLTFYWPFSRIIYYHHAYALLNGEIDREQIQSLTNFSTKFDGAHHQPLLIAHNEAEIKYREKAGFNIENIIVAGNLGYHENWIKILKDYSESLDKLLLDKKGYEKVIFIPVRDTHKIYLSKENSDYLIKSLDAIISSYPNYLFILKPHPRQKNIHEYTKLGEKHRNCRFTDLNTITASKEADLVVCYWSSAIIDALAVNTPVVEFHRHKDWHFQLVNTDKGLVSLYHYLGLCPFYTNVDDIKSLLGDIDSWNQIKDKQQQEFSKIFLKRYPEFVEHLFRRLEESPRQMNSYINSALKFPFDILISNFRKSI